MSLFNFKKWRENERFTARDYMYERNAMLTVLTELETKLETIETQKVILSDDAPTEEMNEGDIWIDIV